MGFGKKPQFFKGDTPLVSRQDSAEFEVTVAKKAENDEDRWAEEDLTPSQPKSKPQKAREPAPKKPVDDGDRWKEEEEFVVGDMTPKEYTIEKPKRLTKPKGRR